ncbi:TetR/AcrR family transcriptional regulator [Zhongshania sp.]|jgi:AcrR family transcriptional regulator|uniref:TetR/AcrR family transcriptional regulator n=1 Tax=Zhongshania sp. TaxID=1971902 RepID=UPI002A8199E0|nr:TetR/AcrR family transcriptional regulator [Zhongshania sp.]
MKKLPPEPRRRPSQSRSKVLVDAIIQACKQVLADEGEERLTTNRIAEVAGVTIGSLYQYFPNKEAILANLLSEEFAAASDQVCREVTPRVAAQIGISLRATIHELIHVTAELHLRYLRLHGSFYREYHDFFDFHGKVNKHMTEVFRQPSWQDWLPDLLRKYKDEIIVNDLDQAGFISANIIEGLISTALKDRPEWLESDVYLNNIETAVMNFLQGCSGE